MAKTWPDPVTAELGSLLDRSLETSDPVQRSFFDKPDRRLDAASFLDRWNSIYMCSVASYGSREWPHLGAIKLPFGDDGSLVMLLYRGSVRERDLVVNPRVALQKHHDDGTVLTIYARTLPSDGTTLVDGKGRAHTHVRLQPVRAYGVGPYTSGPLAVGTNQARSA